jgi:hypothetical protein
VAYQAQIVVIVERPIAHLGGEHPRNEHSGRIAAQGPPESVLQDTATGYAPQHRVEPYRKFNRVDGRGYKHRRHQHDLAKV